MSFSFASTLVLALLLCMGPVHAHASDRHNEEGDTTTSRRRNLWSWPLLKEGTTTTTTSSRHRTLRNWPSLHDVPTLVDPSSLAEALSGEDPSSEAPSAAPTEETCASRSNDTTEKMMECVTFENLKANLAQWQTFADQGDGTRYWSTISNDQTAFYIGETLKQYGYNVTYQLLEYAQYQEDPEKPPIVYSVELDKSFTNAKPPELGEDFATYYYSGSGKVQAPIQVVGYVDPDDWDDMASTSGCEMEDFNDFTAGNIALLQRGSCSTETKIQNAEAAGASAVILSSQGTPGREDLDMVARLELDPYLTHIPAIACSHHMLLELLAVDGTEVYVEVTAVTFPGKTFNVIAETYGGDPDNVFVLGGHLDSEILGPGINDDGSGIAVLLEVAKQAANIDPLNKLRFCFWAAEEVGLIGSTYYVESLSEEEIESIFLYLNADMVASPNYALYIETQDSEGGDGPLETVREYFDTFDIPWERGFGGTCATDMCEFDWVGIQYVDIYTGSSERMSASDVAFYGHGVAGQAHDPCYHLNCDNLSNINEDIFLVNGRAVGYIVVQYAFMPDPPRSASGRRVRRTQEERFDKAEREERRRLFRERKVR